MTNYLADSLKSAILPRLPKNLEEASEKQPLAGLLRVSGEARTLLERDIYAFDLSALNAAADLRIDTPSRLERVIETILRTPRQLFLEADLAEIGVIARNMRGLLDFDTKHKIERGEIRCGAFVDIAGEGRASFRLALGLPLNWIKREQGSETIHAASRTWPPELREWSQFAISSLIDPRTFSIDLSRRVGMTRQEFTMMIERISGFNDPLLEKTQKQLAGLPPSEQARLIDAAWQVNRFRDLFREIPVRQGDLLAHLQILAVTRRTGYNPLSLGLPIIAMLALLQAKADDIRLTPREKYQPRQGIPNRPTTPRPRETSRGLRVITLNLEDRRLQEIYERPGGTMSLSSMKEADRDAPTGGRIRHPVRGHLFLARNGEMTFRRPHWRGSLQETVIHRVIAPSHRR